MGAESPKFCLTSAESWLTCVKSAPGVSDHSGGISTKLGVSWTSIGLHAAKFGWTSAKFRWTSTIFSFGCQIWVGFGHGWFSFSNSAWAPPNLACVRVAPESIPYPGILAGGGVCNAKSSHSMFWARGLDRALLFKVRSRSA